MSRLRTQLSSATTTPLQVGLGAGMIRIWHPLNGLVLELPAVIAVHAQTREPVAWFEEAAALEGKTPQDVECVRPWWADTVTDRAALRALATQLRQVLSASSLTATERAFAPLTLQWRVPPTVSELHRSWLERTLAEAGWWWPRVQRANYSDLTQITQSGSNNAPQTILWDWGSSALRWSVWIGETLVRAQSFPELGLSSIVAGLVEAERAITSRQFSQAALMDLLWTVRHPAFDHNEQQPVFEPLSKTTHSVVQKQWLEAFAQAWQEFQDSLPPETAAQLSVSQCFVIGGGAAIRPWIEAAGTVTKVEWKAAKDPLYAEVRGSAF